MAEVKRHAVVPYSSAEMFALVEDIESYPEFLTWCSGVFVLERTDTLVRANLDYAQAGFQRSITLLNDLQPHSSIGITVEEGPFDDLAGRWHFEALDDEATRVSFQIRYQVSGLILSAIIGPVFEDSCHTLVEAFVDRARSVYGGR